MKKIVITSDKYSFCLDGFQKQVEKYWKGAKFEIMGFNEPKLQLFPSFHFKSFGKGFSDKSNWSDFLNPYFQNLEEDYFFLCFEDHFLIEEVNQEFMTRAEKIMEEDKTVEKIRMHPPYNDRMSLEKYDEHFSLGFTGPHTYIATSLRPAIWRKNLFLKLLNNTNVKIRTPHEFEVYNDRIEIETKVLIPHLKKPIFPDLDAMRQGKINPLAEKKGNVDMDYYQLNLSEEDFQIFEETKKMWDNVLR